MKSFLKIKSLNDSNSKIINSKCYKSNFINKTNIMNKDNYIY